MGRMQLIQLQCCNYFLASADSTVYFIANLNHAVEMTGSLKIVVKHAVQSDASCKKFAALQLNRLHPCHMCYYESFVFQNEKKLINSLNSTNFNNLRNKEENEGFEESVYSKETGQKKRFFNLGFNNRWEKILPKNILNRLNENLQNELNELGYEIKND